MINTSDYELLNIKKISLRDASFDPSNDEYMTNSDIEVINFDTVKTLYTNKLNLSEEVAKSFDALLLEPQQPIFIEFKNGKMKNEKNAVKNKIRDSLLMFCDITKTDISFTRENMDFILVYNEEKNPLPNQLKQETTKPNVSEMTNRVKIGEFFASKASVEFILFDLERFQKLYFRKVKTLTQSQFEEYIKTYIKP